MDVGFVFVIINVMMLVFPKYYLEIAIFYIAFLGFLIIKSRIKTEKLVVKDIEDRNNLVLRYILVPMVVVYLPISSILFFYEIYEAFNNKFSIAFILSNLLVGSITTYIMISYNRRLLIGKQILVLWLCIMGMVGGIYLQMGTSAVSNLLLTCLIIVIILTGDYVSWSKMLLVFLIINQRIQFVSLHILQPEFLTETGLKLEMSFGLDGVVLILLVMVNYWDNILTFINRYFHKKLKTLVFSLSFLGAIILLDIAFSIGVSCIFGISNAALNIFRINVQHFKIPHIHSFVFLIDMMLIVYLYFKMMKKANSSSINSLLIVLPAFVYKLFV